MKLFEDYGNLNKIDSSLLSNLYKKYLNDYELTPNSNIEVNKCLPHTIKHLMEIINDEDVMGVVVRAHKRQLLLIIHDKTSDNVDQYAIVLSREAFEYYNQGDYAIRCIVNNIDFVKAAVRRIIEGFYKKQDESVSPSWDIMIIYKDKNVQNLRDEREKNQEGRFLTPKDKNYDLFIQSLNKIFQQRATEYIKLHQPDFQTDNEIKDYLNKVSTLKGFKYKGDFFELSHTEGCMETNRGITLIFENTTEVPDMGTIQYIYVNLKFKGLHPYIDNIKYEIY